MRPRIPTLIAALSLCGGTALVALPTSPAHAADEWFDLCTTPSQTDCFESVTADGVATVPGPNGVARDVVLLKHGDAPGTIDFSVQHDDGAGTFTPQVTPEVVYRMAVRSSARVRQVYATAKDISFSADLWSDKFEGGLVTLQLTPARADFTNAACSVTSCGNQTTDHYEAVARGTLTNLVSSGVPTVDAHDRSGIAEATNAQVFTSRHNYNLNNYVIQLANPRLELGGGPATMSYEVFFPYFYLQTRFETPNPSSLSRGDFVITMDVPGKTPLGRNAYLRHRDGGLLIDIPSTPGGLRTLKIHPKPSRPGVPRGAYSSKLSATKVRVGHLPPYATGGKTITHYQGRCRKLGTKKWYYATTRTGKKTIVTMPKRLLRSPYQVVCQVRAKNALGYSPFSDPERL